MGKVALKFENAQNTFPRCIQRHVYGINSKNTERYKMTSKRKSRRPAPTHDLVKQWDKTFGLR